MDLRYDRQTRLSQFGLGGQAALAASKVLVVGLGGLGIPVVQYLNAMGVGVLGLVDHDKVELHNLQRQVLYSEKDLGKSKISVAEEKLNQQNSNTQLNLYDTFLTRDNALEIISNYDIVVDATDNFPTRYLINDACVILNKPFVYGALHAFEGHVSLFNYQNGPTYRCLYPTMPNAEEVPDCNENGVLGVVPGIIGTIQALEVVKAMTGIGEPLSGKLLLFDGLSQNSTKIKFKLNPNNLNIKELQGSYESMECLLVPEISAEAYQAKRNSDQAICLIDVRTTKEFANHHLAEARNYPLKDLKTEINLDEHNKVVYVICQSGKRSAKAVAQLQKKYPQISFYSVAGGMNKMTSLITHS